MLRIFFLPLQYEQHNSTQEENGVKACAVEQWALSLGQTGSLHAFLYTGTMCLRSYQILGCVRKGNAFLVFFHQSELES